MIIYHLIWKKSHLTLTFEAYTAADGVIWKQKETERISISAVQLKDSLIFKVAESDFSFKVNIHNQRIYM